MVSLFPLPARGKESGGITILVTLFLLVLLTITAFAMSKNSMREMIISGTSRQAADVRTTADTGLEWSMYWMADDTSGVRPMPASGTAAAALRDLTLSTATDTSWAGRPRPLATTGEMVVGTSTNVTRSFSLQLATMGEITFKGTQINTQQVLDAYNPATLQLWSARSDAQVAYSGGPTFLHSREAWFSLLPKQAQ